MNLDKFVYYIKSFMEQTKRDAFQRCLQLDSQELVLQILKKAEKSKKKYV